MTFHEEMDSFSGEKRAEALYYYFGWQGGTIHQLVEVTGVSIDDILYNSYQRQQGLNSAYNSGFSGVRTCSRDWRKNTLAPKYFGNVPYWHGVIEGYWITGKLSDSLSGETT
jgi:hypothetical protein